MALKNTKIIDLNLFSGSSEQSRQIVKSYFYISETNKLEFSNAELSDLEEVEKIVRDDITTEIKGNFQDTRKYANRIYVDQSFNFVSDEHWRIFLIGGNFQDKEYDGIYNDNIYADHYNISPLPELARENINTDVQPSVLLTTEYYNYYPIYQNEIDNIESELQAPNFYLLDSSSYFVPSYDDGVVQSKYQYENLKVFLEQTYPNSEKILNSKMENIFILKPSELNESNDTRYDTKDLLKIGGIDDDYNFLYSLMPFGNKLEITDDMMSTLNDVTYTSINPDSYKNIINNNNYRTKFLKLLKEVFQNESRLQTSDIDFAVNTSTIESTGVLTGSVEKTETKTFKVVDLPTMLLYAYKNPISETDNITVFNSSSYFESEGLDYVFDKSGMHRFINTEKTLKVFSEFIDQINIIFNYYFLGLNYYDGLFDYAQFTKHYETMAFRIEKIGGEPTGDSRTQNTIQNIWFYNEKEAIKYFDTQVKYDTEYTYKIYKYDIVQGYKYKTSDLRYTKQSALTSSGDTSVYCLQFHDAETRLPAPKLIGLSSEIDYLERTLEPLYLQLESLEAQKDEALGVLLKIDNMKGFLLETNGSQYYSLRNRFQTSGNWPSYPYAVEEVIVSYEDVTVADGELSFPAADIILEKILRGGPDFGSANRPSDYPEYQLDYIYDLIYNAADPLLSEIEIGPPGIPPENRIKITVRSFLDRFYPDARSTLESIEERISLLKEVIAPLQSKLDLQISARDNLTSTADNSVIISSYPYLADINVVVTPSVKVVEIPIEEKRMRILDHPPNDLIVTPHHLLDQSNRIAFYCKYDTFSMDTVAHPPILAAQDEINRGAYLAGHDFNQISKLTQESISPARFIEVYRTSNKPTSYSNFTGNLRKTIDLKQKSGDIPTDHLFIENVRENTKYYYIFRPLSENRVAGQLSPIFEAELINDGGYVYAKFEQFSEEELAIPLPKEPLLAFKKLFNIIPNIQHLELDTSEVSFVSSSVSQMSSIQLGTSAEDSLWNANKYYKIRLTSKKTGKKFDLNIGFKKEERN